MHQRSIWKTFGLVLLLSACMTTLASGDISVADLAALGDADYARRHEAMRRLLADESLSTAQIARAFHKAESVEQKHRLMSLARHHLLREARNRDFPMAAAVGFQNIPGALGLTHGPVTSEELPQLNQSGVRVRRTLPGFPAHAALEVGDLVLAIENNPIPAGFTADQISRHFGDAIQMVAAGDTVKLQVQRDGKVIDVKVRLAPHAALGGMYQPELRSNYEKLWTRFRDDVLLKAQ